MAGPNMPPLGHQPDHLRAGHEVLTGKSRVLGIIGLVRGGMQRLMGANGQNIREMRQKQLIESGHDPAHSEQIAEISAMTMTGDPHTIRHEFDHQFLLNHNPVELGQFEVSPRARVNATVRYTHTDPGGFWQRQRSVDEIFNEIRDMDVNTLRNELGIDLNSVPFTGIGPVPVLQQTATLTEADARRMAEILHVPYLRAHFGDASETNMAMAQSMAYEMLLAGDNNFLSILKVPDASVQDAEKVRRGDLISLIRDLDKIAIPSDRSLAQLNTDLGIVNASISAVPPPPLNELKELRNERNALNVEIAKYNRFADQLRSIQAQIGRVRGAVMPPAASEFMRLVGGLGALTTTDSPKNVAFELSSHFAELISEMEKSKNATPAPKVEAPDGAEALIRIYEAYLQKTQNLTPRMARSRAAQMFMENEYTADEHHFIDNTIRRDIAGGILTPQQGLFNGVAGYLKGFTSSGSDEARVSRIAEAAGVTRAVGEGGLLNATMRSGIFRGRFNPLRLIQGPLEVINRANNALFGTRVLGVTPFAKYRASPAWGEIAGDRFKLRAAWDALREAAHHGEFTNSWYIQDQLMQVAHLLIASEHQQIADAIAKMSPEERQKMGANSVREFILNHLHDILEHGFVHGPLAKEQPHAVTATYKKAETAKKKVGSRRRALKSWFFDEEDAPSTETRSHHQAA